MIGIIMTMKQERGIVTIHATLPVPGNGRQTLGCKSCRLQNDIVVIVIVCHPLLSFITSDVVCFLYCDRGTPNSLGPPERDTIKGHYLWSLLLDSG